MPAQPITIPSTNELRRRIQACRTELDELKRLLKMAIAAERADRARQSRIEGDAEGDE